MNWYTTDALVDLAALIMISLYMTTGLRLLSSNMASGVLNQSAEMFAILLFYNAVLCGITFVLFRYQSNSQPLSRTEFTVLVLTTSSLCVIVC